MDEDMLYKKITLKMMWLLHIKHCKSFVKILLQYMFLKCFIGFSQTKHCHVTMLRNLF